MPEPAVLILPFHFAHASEHEYQAIHRFANIMQAEILPDDPPVPLEEMIAGMKNVPDFISASAWAAWDSEQSKIVGSANVGFMKTDENMHLAWCDLSVLPEYRRQGIGRRLLEAVAEVPKRENRRLMMTGTNARVPAGEAFMERLGGERAMESHTNQLVLAELDQALLVQWMMPDEAGRFTLESWEGPHPEDLLPAITALNENAMNTSPRDNIDMEDMHFTPEQMRQMDQQTLAGGTERWTLAAREAASGKFVGYTEVLWNASRPQILRQGGTGVYTEFQGHGLGKRLKAAMLDKVLRERPEARFVRTGNADSNGPMLRINHALGFRPYLSRTEWQVKTSKVLAYLDVSA
jgi:mycothiol synthase